VRGANPGFVIYRLAAPGAELSPIFGDGLIDQAVTKNRR
jgi:hypothetical protein